MRLPRLLSLCIALLVYASDISAQSSNAQAQALARLRSITPGLVKMFVYCNGDARPWRGAGVVFTDSGHILTAAHLGNECMSGADSVKVGVISTLYEVPRESHRATLIQRSADNSVMPTKEETSNARFQDVALYRLAPGGAHVAPARLARDPVVAGDPIHVAGFADLPYRASGDNVTRGGPTIYRTSVGSVTPGPTGRAQRLHYEGGTWAGQSGGPVYNSANEVVAIHSARRSRLTTNLLNTKCDPDHGPACVGNAIAFTYRDTLGAARKQVINIDIGSLKDILDNFGWASSIEALPAQWPRP